MIKKFLSSLLCLILLFSFTACSNSQPAEKKKVNAITEQAFLTSLKAMDTTVTITPMPVVDGNEKNQSICAFTLSNNNTKNLSHMSITINKDTNQIIDISIFSDCDYLLKADGSKEKQNNLDFCLHVNQIGLALDKNLDVDKFSKKYTTMINEPEGVLGEEALFTYRADCNGENEDVFFTLK